MGIRRRKPKGKALIEKVWREDTARRSMDPCWKRVRIRSAKGKTGYTRREAAAMSNTIREEGIGRVDFGFRFIESI